MVREPRRILPAALIALGFVIVGVGVANATDISSDVSTDALTGGVDEVEAANVNEAVLALEKSHQASVSRAMKAPVLLGVKRKKLESIAECESHGDPRARSSDGTYRGKYQFDKGTWEAMGGSGDPAKAPELEQDIRAAELYKVASSSPWPVCG